MKRVSVDDVVIDYLAEPSGNVALCNVCASKGDHGKGQLIRPLGYERAGDCQGALHDGCGCTLEEAKAQRTAARRRLRNFSAYDVCALPAPKREEFARVARVVLGGGE